MSDPTPVLSALLPSAGIANPDAGYIIVSPVLTDPEYRDGIQRIERVLPHDR